MMVARKNLYGEVGRGPVFRYYEGSVASSHRPAKSGKAAEQHRWRAISRVKADGPDKYLVLSACADCSATKVDDINPDEKAARKAHADRVARYRRIKPKGRSA